MLKNGGLSSGGEELNLERKALLDEIKILAFIGKHENVVELKGVRKDQLWLALEYCEHGSLKCFLTGKRDRGLYIDEIERQTALSSIGYWGHVTPQDDSSIPIPTVYKVRQKYLYAQFTHVVG